MLDQLDAADSVLVISTETYYRRFRGHEQPDIGIGVDQEGALITQEIYHARSRTLKFVPVFLSAANENRNPEPLGSGSHHALTADSAYERLYDFGSNNPASSRARSTHSNPSPVAKALHRARLFGSGVLGPGSGEKYPWQSPATNLAAAAKIILHESRFAKPDGTAIRARYTRRDEELSDAQRALLGT